MYICIILRFFHSILTSLSYQIIFCPTKSFDLLTTTSTTTTTEAAAETTSEQQTNKVNARKEK